MKCHGIGVWSLNFRQCFEHFDFKSVWPNWVMVHKWRSLTDGFSVDNPFLHLFLNIFGIFLYWNLWWKPRKNGNIMECPLNLNDWWNPLRQTRMIKTLRVFPTFWWKVIQSEEAWGLQPRFLFVFADPMIKTLVAQDFPLVGNSGLVKCRGEKTGLTLDRPGTILIRKKEAQKPDSFSKRPLCPGKSFKKPPKKARSEVVCKMFRKLRRTGAPHDQSHGQLGSGKINCANRLWSMDFYHKTIAFNMFGEMFLDHILANKLVLIPCLALDASPSPIRSSSIFQFKHCYLLWWNLAK